MKEDNWLLFKLSDLLAKVERGTVRFHEFLRTPSLSCSVYHIPAGSKEMESAHEEETEIRYYSERCSGSFFRKFRLGRQVDPEKIQATYKDGVLTLEIGKREEAQPKQIPVASA